MNKLLKKSIAVLSAMAMAVTMFSGTAVFADNSEGLGDDDVIILDGISEYYEGHTSVILDRFIGNSIRDGKVDLAKGNHEKWIDRIDIPDYGMEAYNAFIEATDNDGVKDYLIDPKKAKNSTYNGVEIKVIPLFTTTVKSDQEINYTREVALAAFAAFDRDHPEVFWLDGGAWPAWTKRGSELTCLFIVQSDGLDYDMRSSEYRSAAKIKKDIKNVNKYASNIIEFADGSEYEIVKYFNTMLTYSNSYNTYVATDRSKLAPKSTWECISALEGRTGTKGPVCEAYARAMKVLCDRVGIHCVLVDGNAGGAHMWNNIQVDGEWYLVDSTWNDPFDDKDDSAYSGWENEDYLLIGSDSKRLEGRTVGNSHFEGGPRFINGPVLSRTDYDPANAVSVKSIAVTKQPSKKSYKAGEAFDATGLEIKVTKTDGKTETVKYSSSTKSSFKFDPETLSVGDTKVTVTYKGKSAVISGITVTKKSGREYTVKFYANDGTNEMLMVKMPAGINILPGQLFEVPAGKVFTGWSTSRRGKVITTYNIRRNVNFYAILEDGEEIEDPDDPELDECSHENTKWKKTSTYHWGTCPDCGTVFDKEKHTFDEGVVTKKPTATKNGTKTYTCTVCKRTKKVPIPKGTDPDDDEPEVEECEHTNIKWKKSSTYHQGTCLDCGTVFDREDHCFDIGVITKIPTTSSGRMTYSCRLCGYNKKITINRNAEPCVVTFADYGSGVMYPVDAYTGKYILPGQLFEAPAGKKFAGWSLSPDGMTVETYNLTGDTIFYAVWVDA